MIKKAIFLIITLVLIPSCKNVNTQTNAIEIPKKQETSYNQKPQDKISLTREENENTKDFLNRTHKDIDNLSGYDVQLTDHIMETKDWISNSSVIFAFYDKSKKDHEDEDDAKSLEGYVYVSNNEKKYTVVLIDTYFPEGSNAKIESIFLANADNDSNKELIVLCSWKQDLKETTEGKIYQTYIYDDLNPKNIVKKIHYLQDASSNFEMEFEGIQEGVNITAKYNTEKQIRLKLKALGY